MTATVRRVLASVLAWVVGAAAAVGVGLLALSLIDDGLASPPLAPLTTEAVAHDASDGPAAPDYPQSGASASVRPVTAAPDRLITSPGGTAMIRCGDAGAYLVTWIPEPGYRVEDVRRGPGVQVSVAFESGERRVLLSARCIGGIPEPRVAQLDDDDHGGRR
jgi:hypothetical protein